MKPGYYQNEDGGPAHIYNHNRDAGLCGALIDPIRTFVYAPLDPPLCKACLGPGRPVRPHGPIPEGKAI